VVVVNPGIQAPALRSGQSVAQEALVGEQTAISQ